MPVLEGKDSKSVRDERVTMKPYKWSMFWPHCPDIDRLLEELRDTFESRWWGQGPKVNLFEEKFQSRFSATQAIMTNSGTSALQLAFRLAGIENGDHVVSSPVTCTAVHHALKLIGAHILLCDVEPNSLNPDPKSVESLCERGVIEGSPIRAIVPVHLAGRPCDISAFRSLSINYSIPIIYDACQALGAKYEGNDVSHYSNCGDGVAFSFQAVKAITMGDGGVLAVADAEVAERGKSLRWFSIDRERRQKEFQWKLDSRPGSQCQSRH